MNAHTSPPNARFWHYGPHGPVKLTLRPGQSLTHSTGGRTDEGWSRSSMQWTHEGDAVLLEWCDDGSDCDGRLTQTGGGRCALGRLASGESDPEAPEVIYPAWQTGVASVRDYSAEAAGY